MEQYNTTTITTVNIILYIIKINHFNIYVCMFVCHIYMYLYDKVLS